MKKQNLRVMICFVVSILFTIPAFSQSCDTLRNFNPTASLYEYSTTTGYIMGHSSVSDGTNNYNATEWVEPYTVTGSSQVRAVRFIPFKAQNNSGSAALVINVYANNAGSPGSILGSQTVLYSDLFMNSWNLVEFTTPVNVSGDIFVGYELNYTAPVDTFAMLTALPAVNYTKFQITGSGSLGGNWLNVSDVYTDASNNPINTAFVFEVLLSTSTVPTPNFTLTNTEACLSGGFAVDASASTGAVDEYEWLLTDDPITQIYVDEIGAQTDYIQPTTASYPSQQRLILFTNGACVSKGVYQLVTVYPDVNATFTPTATTCGNNNGQIVVNATGGSGSYAYSLDAGNPNATGTFTNVSPGVHSVEIITNGDGCSYTQNVTISNTPGETITIGTSPTICAGDNATLSASGSGTIEWFDGMTSLGTGTSMNVSPSTTTSYTATLTDANGCTDTKSITVTVNSGVDANFAYPSNTICIGSANVAPTVNTSGGIFTTNVSGLVFTNSSTGEIDMTNSIAGTYDITYTIAGTCGNASTQQVTITSSPVATFSYPSNIFCQNDGTTAPVFGTGASAGTFSSTVGLSINAATGIIDLTSSLEGSYLINNQISASGSCPAISESYSITVNATPTVNAGVDESICVGDQLTLTATNVTPVGATITWDNSVSDGIAFTPAATNTYTVTADNNGCTITDDILVEVNVTPTVTAGADQSICNGTSLTLSATSTPTSAVVSWDNGVNDGVPFSPTSTQTYTVTSNNNGCIATDQLLITVNPTPIVDAGQDQNICIGQDVTLIASGTATTYLWDNNVTDGVPFTPNVGTTVYTLTGEANGCSAIDQIVVTVYSLPSVTVGNDMMVCSYDPAVTLTGGSPAGGSYSGTSVVNNSFDPGAGIGSYTITYTFSDANSCVNSASFEITVDDCAGIENQVEYGFIIAPNPANHDLVVKAKSSINQSNIQMISVVGKIMDIPMTMIDAHAVKLDVSSLSKGTYFIRLVENDYQSTRKVIIK